MQRAERQPIRDNWFAFRLTVRHDVRGIEELLVIKSAESTLLSVRIKHPLSKRPLM